MSATATSSDDGFLDAILREPGDDAHRLVYADWLEDRGDPRGEFIRVQVELAKIGHLHPPADAEDRATIRTWHALRRREAELLEAPHRGGRWTNRYVWAGGPGSPVDLACVISDGVTFRRGFVASVTCTLAAWCGEACSFENRGCRAPASRGTLAGLPVLSACGQCRVGARGPALVRAAPLWPEETAVRLSGEYDVSPHGTVAWDNNSGLWQVSQGGVSLLLPPLPPVPPLVPPPPLDPWWGRPDAEREALSHAWLSRALLAWARQQP